MQRVDKMDTETMIMVLDGDGVEMVLNSCLEDLEGKIRLKRMWKFVPQVWKKRNK